MNGETERSPASTKPVLKVMLYSSCSVLSRWQLIGLIGSLENAGPDIDEPRKMQDLTGPSTDGGWRQTVSNLGQGGSFPPSFPHLSWED